MIRVSTDICTAHVFSLYLHGRKNASLSLYNDHLYLVFSKNFSCYLYLLYPLFIEVYFFNSQNESIIDKVNIKLHNEEYFITHSSQSQRTSHWKIRLFRMLWQNNESESVLIFHLICNDLWWCWCFQLAAKCWIRSCMKFTGDRCNKRDTFVERKWIMTGDYDWWCRQWPQKQQIQPLSHKSQTQHSIKYDSPAVSFFQAAKAQH